MKESKKTSNIPAPKGVFAGLTTVDIVFSFGKYPDEDTKNTARQFIISAGGPATNAAIVFSYLGGDGCLISSIGQSRLSIIAKKDLLQYGVKHIDITEKRKNEPTLSVVSVSELNGSRTILTSPAIDDEFTDPFDNHKQIISSVEGANILLLDGHQTDLSVGLAECAKKNGVVVVLDGDLYQPAIEKFLPFVDIVIFGKNFIIPGKNKTKELFNYFESFGIKYVIATNGEHDIEFISDGAFNSIEVPKVEVVDTLAAGDFFHGAFCYYYAKVRDIKQSLEFAAKIAGISVTKFGTRSWMKENE